MGECAGVQIILLTRLLLPATLCAAQRGQSNLAGRGEANKRMRIPEIFFVTGCNLFKNEVVIAFK